MGVNKAVTSFEPPMRTLMGPGPSDVHPRVLAAMARPTIGHLDPEFGRMMDELQDLIRYAFQTENAVTFPASGPGSVGMEMCLVNLVEPGDEVVVCQNGVFGARMAENVVRCGGIATVVEEDWGKPVSVDRLATTLAGRRDAKLVAFVQAETSTGVHSDPKPLVDVAHAHDCLVVVDVVTALAGCPVRVDEWGIDATYAGTQKCLSCPPGLAPVTFGERALARIRQRETRCQSWFMDLDLLLGYWSSGQRVYHHTAPVNALYGLHEALLMLREEGLEHAWKRHRTQHLALAAGLDALGLRLLVDEPYRLPQLNTVLVPEGVDEALVRGRLLDEFDLEIGAGLGALSGKAWRIGLMGHSCREQNVLSCLRAYEETLSDLGLVEPTGNAELAARRAEAESHEAEGEPPAPD